MNDRFMYPPHKYLIVMELSEAVQDAYDEAKYTYECADQSPVDHGHAFIKGVDGRKAAVQELKQFEHARVDVGGYHGTTIHLDGVSRYLTAQRGAYDAFMKALQENGFNLGENARVWARAD